MKRIVLFLILIFINVSLFSQVPLDSLINNLNCFKKVLKVGFKLGYWDVDSIQNIDSNCKNYVINQNFKTDTDTLIITKEFFNANSEVQNYYLKAVIESDSAIYLYIYLPSVLDSKTKRRLARKENQGNIKSLCLVCRLEDEACTFNFAKPKNR